MKHLQHLDHWHWYVAVLVLVVGSARLTRLIVHDSYPPMVWLRNRFRKAVNDGPWAKLVDCHYCASPYVVAGLGAWGYFTDLQLAWWLVVGWLAASYVAAIVVSFDGDA